MLSVKYPPNNERKTLIILINVCTINDMQAIKVSLLSKTALDVHTGRVAQLIMSVYDTKSCIFTVPFQDQS